MGHAIWLEEQADTEKYGNELLYQVNIRNQQSRAGIQFSRIESKINVMLKKYRSRVSDLEDQLQNDDISGAISRPEAERRRTLLGQLTFKLRQLETVLNEAPGTSARNELLNTGRSAESAASSDHVNQFRPYHDESPSQSPTPGTASGEGGNLRQLTQQLKRQQDAGLDVLDAIITRQKGLVTTIGTQIDEQNDLIDEIGTGMERTSDRLVKNTRNIGRVSQKSNTGCYWFVIIALFIAIVVVALV